MPPGPEPPGTVPLTGPPPPAIDPKATEWQGNPWMPCPASALEYIGTGPRVSKPTSVNFNSVPADAQDEVIILGIEPRPPSPSEYKAVVDWLPGLARICWWVTEDFSVGGYNCFGYVVAREAVARGDKIRVLEPANEIPVRVEGSTIDTYDAFFGRFGYTRMPDPPGTVPQPGRIAWFTEAHVALRSDYRYQGEDLWESKLGTFRLRILHPLRAIESQEYGRVARWYRIA
jgi:hypothetical protein